MARADPPSARDDETPYLGAAFRVRISGTPSARRAAGLAISHVAWGPFPVAQREAHEPAVLPTGDGLPARHVLLRRGLTGETELADWWRAESAPKPSTRTVMVELIEPESGATVLTWTFSGCRVVQLSHSALDAQLPTVVTESLVFEYSNVDID